jgi:hypothetical protein
VNCSPVHLQPATWKVMLRMLVQKVKRYMNNVSIIV